MNNMNGWIPGEQKLKTRRELLLLSKKFPLQIDDGAVLSLPGIRFAETIQFCDSLVKGKLQYRFFENDTVVHPHVRWMWSDAGAPGALLQQDILQAHQMSGGLAPNVVVFDLDLCGIITPKIAERIVQLVKTLGHSEGYFLWLNGTYNRLTTFEEAKKIREWIVSKLDCFDWRIETYRDTTPMMVLYAAIKPKKEEGKVTSQFHEIAEAAKWIGERLGIAQQKLYKIFMEQASAYDLPNADRGRLLALLKQRTRLSYLETAQLANPEWNRSAMSSRLKSLEKGQSSLTKQHTDKVVGALVDHLLDNGGWQEPLYVTGTQQEQIAHAISDILSDRGAMINLTQADIFDCMDTKTLTLMPNSPNYFTRLLAQSRSALEQRSIQYVHHRGLYSFIPIKQEETMDRTSKIKNWAKRIVAHVRKEDHVKITVTQLVTAFKGEPVRRVERGGRPGLPVWVNPVSRYIRTEILGVSQMVIYANTGNQMGGLEKSCPWGSDAMVAKIFQYYASELVLREIPTEIVTAPAKIKPLKTRAKEALGEMKDLFQDVPKTPEPIVAKSKPAIPIRFTPLAPPSVEIPASGVVIGMVQEGITLVAAEGRRMQLTVLSSGKFKIDTL